MIKVVIWTTLILLPLTSCDKVHCVPNLELQVMYGRQEKCKKQQQIDRRFIDLSVAQYGSRERACTEMLRFGWKHLANGNHDMAMMRFNQAWLLDSLNADVYFGFANILTDWGNFKEATAYYDRSHSIDPQNLRILTASARNYEALYETESDSLYLKQAIRCLEEAIHISPDNIGQYASLIEKYKIILKE